MGTKTIDQFGNISSLASGDELLIWDVSISLTRKVALSAIDARYLLASGPITLSGGKVGINQPSPLLSDLHIGSAGAGGTQVRLENTDAGGRSYVIISSGSLSTGGAGKFIIVDSDSGNRLVYDGANNRLGINALNPGTTLDVGGLATAQSFRATADGPGVAGQVTYGVTTNTGANSTGVGTVKMKSATSRDSAGFLKIYVGTTAYYVPFFSAITG